MAETFDLIIRGGTVVNHEGQHRRDVGVRKGRTAALGDLAGAGAAEVVDARGLHVLPGVIDTQVHFREPGLEHKEDLESGSRAAVLGGVTAVFEMPNTRPPTVDGAALADKLERASGRMHCDYAFYVGATPENARELPTLERRAGVCGVKVFMGSSTGALLVADDEALEEVLRNINRRAAFHAEDEARLEERKPLRREGEPASHPVWRDELTAYRATERLLRLAHRFGKRVHVLHVTTGEEMELLATHKTLASVEVTPQHLTLAAPDCYERLGTYAQMNPPIRDSEQRRRLWQAVAAGVVDVLGSDHAPHTREEKEAPYPGSPSGMPGVQTLVPVMLDHVNAGRLSLERFVDLTSHGPNRLFGLARKGRLEVGYDADYTIVDLQAERTIEDSWIASKCGWTPFAGRTVTGWPCGTIIRGQRVMWEDEIVTPSSGRPIAFRDTDSKARA